MVKIPALELDGRNWKIYRAKLIEAAATHIVEPLGVLAGWEENDGSDDWEGQDATAKFLIYPTLPLELLRPIRKLDTAHEMFMFLARRFHDYDPIKRDAETKLVTCANDAKRAPSAESPTSKNAATGAEREDPPMKDLTRGTEDVDDGNVGRKDPRTSLEASAKGTSAKCTETTVVVLESTPHETQNVPQNPLPLTPGECKQEAADGVVTAERTKGMVGMAKPRKLDADVDGTAALGGEPAERVQGVDEGGRKVADVDGKAVLGGEPAERIQGVGEGDETERDGQSRLQQTIFYCKESRQHDENANANVPSAYRLPLEGEWLVCASGEASDWNGDANASNAAIERVDSPSESRVAEDTPGVESEGCKGGTSGRASVDELETIVECCQQLGMADGDGDRGVEPTGTPNESDALVIASIEAESPDSGGIPRVHLGSTSWRAGDVNGPGNGADGSTGQVDESRDSTDTLDMSNSAATAVISDGEDAETYLDVRGAKRVIDATDGVTRHADATTGYGDAPSVETDALTTANATEIVSTPRKRKKPPDSLVEAAKCAPDEPNGCGDPTDTSSVCTDVPNVETHAKTPANETGIVSIPRKREKPPDSPMETARRRPDEPNGCGSRADGSSARTLSRTKQVWYSEHGR